jgi:membrane protease YdiL (CAAX protease family)
MLEDALLRATLLKVATPALAIVIALVVSRVRGISWRDAIGFRAPTAASVVLWLGVWIAWTAIGEILIGALGLDQAQPWPPYPALIVGLRVLAIGLLGPAAEEIVMRGLLWSRLRLTPLGPFGALLAVAVLWSSLHVQYGAGTVALIAGDGVVLGLARMQSGSIWLPVAMHAIGNLVSIAQSMGMVRS